MLSLVTMERSQSYKGRPRASDGRSLATSSEMGVKKCFCEEPMLFSLATCSQLEIQHLALEIQPLVLLLGLEIQQLGPQMQSLVILLGLEI
ncbi:hypothetical protein D0Y65_055016 [Glycine soja]|uniref:Uncharacterized protein n=1 Tax=Glycine soja TaxID=3848 RepID=A0A445F9K4_GLYSO|nr:hypothetical protein D0Y65_055016 [Glycine soja]